MATRFSILVVDDEPINIKVMLSALGDEYDIIPALNGFDAITLLREHPVDLILLDVLMPEISGFDVCTMIKSDEAFIDIPVIFLTAFDTEEGELRGLVLGGIDYLTKPINYDLLRQRIRNHVVLKAKNDLMKLQVDQLARQKEELAQMVAEQKQLNKLLSESEATLKERIKELNCLYLVSSIAESPDLSRMLTRAVEQSPATIMITDPQGVIEFVNPKFTELTGYSAEEAVGQNPRVMKSGMTPPETYQKLWSAITAGKTWQGEFVNKRKDGSIFYEHAIISALHNEDGAITHYMAVKEDITEKKSIMAQLIHSQKMESIGELAGGLAHDLNNILCVVNGYATMLKITMPQHEEPQQILEATSRAASLTHALLAYSRKQEMQQSTQNLNQLIADIVAFIKQIIHGNIEFTLSLADDPLFVFADKVQIEQVMLNLATNARDAMPGGGTFSITTSTGSVDERFIATHGFGEIGNYAVITVSDTGHGMDAETVLKVFDPFFTTKEAGKGTGLGLSMVLGIVRQHGGYISIESEPDRGAVFRLYLPLVNAGINGAAVTTAIANVKPEKASGTI